MGKRVNLAELAREEVPDTYSPPPRLVPAEPAPEVASGAADAAADNGAWDTTLLPIAEIVSNPLNQRAADDDADEDFDQLVSTIRGHGVLQPIVVCSAQAFSTRYPNELGDTNGVSWVALIGNRRLRAAAAAGLDRIPALVNDDRVASMYEVMLVENSHRKSLSPLHEAEAMQRLLLEAKINQRALAGRIGRTPMYVSQRMTLLGLIPALREVLEAGMLKLEQARQFGGLPEHEQEAIAAAGPPYRRPVPGAVNRETPPAPRRRSIAISSPARAAASIREVFTETERAELIRLLSEPATEPAPDDTAEPEVPSTNGSADHSSAVEAPRPS